MHTFTDIIKNTSKVFVDTFDPERRARARVLSIIPAEPPLIYPAAFAKVHPLRDGPWVFIWAEPPTPHGVKEYVLNCAIPTRVE